MDDLRELYNLIRSDIKTLVKEAVSEAIEQAQGKSAEVSNVKE